MQTTTPAATTPTPLYLNGHPNATARRRVLFMALLSVGVHAAVIGIAALLPPRPVVPGEAYLEPVGGDDNAPVPDPDGLNLPPPEQADESPDTPTPDAELSPAVEQELPPPPAENETFIEPTPQVKPVVKQPTKPSSSATRTTAATSPTGPSSPIGTGPAGPRGSGWKTPKPPYPYLARARRLSGSGSVRVRTDATGRVISAEVVEPIAPELDGTTVSFARSHWSGPPNTTAVVPVTYQFR